jgi:hypothetical protein
MGKGSILEYGEWRFDLADIPASPRDLLRDPSSYFYQLCQAGGDDEFDKLFAMLK